jgi:outer membrane biosynthesis protein TonB
MRTGLTISCAGHAAFLLWSVLTLVVQPYHAEPLKGLPVDLISSTEFMQMANGAKNAPQQEHPKAVAEKVAEAAPVDDPTAKLAKKEVKAAADVPPPMPESKPPEPKAKKPPPPAPADPIAEALKKDEPKPEPKKPDPKPPTPPKKLAQQEPAPQFDPRTVRALLDKRESQRVASAAGSDLNSTAALGGTGGTGGHSAGFFGNPEGLTDGEKMALRARLREMWNPPPGMRDHKEMTLDVQFQLNPDGTLSGPPVVLTRGSNTPLFVAASDSAKRAVIRGQPYTMLNPQHYDTWKDLEITFDPSDPQMMSD